MEGSRKVSFVSRIFSFVKGLSGSFRMCVSGGSVRKFIFIIILGIGISGIHLFSEDKLNLSNLLERFKEHSPDFVSSLLSLESARANYREYMAGLYPSVSTSTVLSVVNNTKTEGTYLGSDYTIENARNWSLTPSLSINQYLPTGGTLTLTLKDNLGITSNGSITPDALSEVLGGTEARYSNTPEIGLTLSQPIFFEDAYGAGKRIAENNLKIAKKNYLSRLNSEVFALVNEYFNLKFLKSKLQLISFRFNDAKASYETTKKRYKLGKVSRLNLLRAEAAFKKAGIDWESARENFVVAKKRFCMKYGFDDSVAIDSTIEDICDYSILKNREEVVERTLSGNVNLALANYNLSIAMDNLINTKLSRAPVVTIGGGLSFSTTAGSTTDFKSALENSFNDNASPVISGSITLSAKLFDAGSFDAKLKAARSSMESERYRLKAEREKIKGKVEDLLDEIEKTKKLYEYAKLNLQIAEMEYEKAKTDFRLGRTTQGDLNKYNMELENARLDLLNYRMEINSDYLNILILMGENLLSVLKTRKD